MAGKHEHWLFWSISEEEILNRVLRLEAAARTALQVGEIAFSANPLATAARAALLDALGQPGITTRELPMSYVAAIDPDNLDRENLWQELRPR